MRSEGHIVVGMFVVNGSILWDVLEPSELPNDLIGLHDGKLVWILPGGIDVKTFRCEMGSMSTADLVNSVKRPHLPWRLLTNNDSMFGAVLSGAIKTLALRPAVGVSRWCHKALNFLENVKVMPSPSEGDGEKQK